MRNILQKKIDETKVENTKSNITTKPFPISRALTCSFLYSSCQIRYAICASPVFSLLLFKFGVGSGSCLRSRRTFPSKYSLLPLQCEKGSLLAAAGLDDGCVVLKSSLPPVKPLNGGRSPWFHRRERAFEYHIPLVQTTIQIILISEIYSLLKEWKT
jgi:hypothetical protein